MNELTSHSTAATAPGVTGDDGDGPERSSRLRAGSLIAHRYRLEARLGAGAMGEVWRARHEELNMDVAIKFALADGRDRDAVLERFRFEAQVAAQLSSRTPRVVAVHDAGLFESMPYLAMECVAGRSLEQILETEGAQPPARVAELVEQVAEALAVAHAQGIWHRDIKPANLLVIEEGDRWAVKVADFGVAKALDTSLDVDAPKTTSVGALIGTPAYMSPEQITGAEPTAKSDLWSLAVVAYEALSGELPFRAPTVQGLMRVISIGQRPPPLPRQSPAVDAWFRRALAPDPDRRFAVDELAEAFRVAITRAPRRRARVWAAALSAALAVGSAVILWPEAEAAKVPLTLEPLSPLTRANVAAAKTREPAASAAPANTPPAPAPRVPASALPEPRTPPVPIVRPHPPPEIPTPRPIPSFDPSEVH